MSYLIRCKGGPKDGKVFTWMGAFPKSIVFQDVRRGVKVEYFRKSNSSEYVYADDIPKKER